MSWMERLYQTYENNAVLIGSQVDANPLLPICHTTQNAQVHVVVDGFGNFLRAHVVPKSDARTIIPSTEKSAGRTNRPVPHPLSDKLQYVAADYPKFGGDREACFDEYFEQISAWCSFDFSHPKVCAVREYLKKGTLLHDLIAVGVLYAGGDGKLLQTWPGKNKEAPEIFSVLQGEGGQSDALVRFSVERPGDPQVNLWTDRSIWESWINHYRSTRTGLALCYVTGNGMPLAEQHPAKIRNSADKAKLISSNDSSGFTFRGRFTTAEEVCGVGFEVTQKAHNALRWLIARQGYRDGSQAIVAWAVSGTEVPDIFADTLTLLSGNEGNATLCQTGYTAQETGEKLKKLIAGYSVELGSTDGVIVMGLDAATPGRMAIRYYRELTGSEFLERVFAWHAGCCWRQNLGKDRVFIGAPAPRDIAEAAYARRMNGRLLLDDNLRKSTTARLLPCIIDGVPIPRDIVGTCVHRACNRVGYGEHWDWEKALGIACALYKHYHGKRRYAMALERDRHTRDYLYGRLLALAEHLEGRALNVAGEKRETNAAKLMQRFADRPHSTWLTIETSLTPSKARLRANRPGFLLSVEREIDEVMDSFILDDFLSDHRLTGEFLLSYHCQRSALWAGSSNASSNQEDSEEDN